MCGIFGIYSHSPNAARLTFFGLLALQHRGQESAGISSSNFKKIFHYKNIGLVNQIFKEEIIKKLPGNLAIGHTRYSTTGDSNIENCQPLKFASNLGDFVIAHNGNLANYKTLKKMLLEKGHCFNTTSDTELIARMIILSKGKTWQKKIINGLSQIKGAYSLLILTKEKIFVIRDPWGIRPLVLGKLNSGWVAASETCAIDTVNGKFYREVLPGEIIEISQRGLKIYNIGKVKKKGFCIFEYVYFSRPDSVINNRLVQVVRVNAGKILAKEGPVKADLVISVPDSGTSAALGFAEESKIPFHEGLIKSRYVDRTFIQPEQKIRDLGVKLKFNPLTLVVKNKEIVLVDDSIVRGTTIKKIIKMLRKAGAKKIHLRIASPPFRNICYLGVDVSRYQELIAAKHPLEKIKKIVGADSLVYLSLEGLKQATGLKKTFFCTGCFNNDYPVKLENNQYNDNQMKKIAILISNIGTGTNLQAIIDGINNKIIQAKIDAVVSDSDDAYGIKRAEKNNLPVYIISSKEKILSFFKKKKFDYIVLAGWKKIIPNELIDLYPSRILNLHPGLIPDKIDEKVKNPDGSWGLWNRGLLADKAIENFLKNKATYAGSSIHFLTHAFDFGPVLARCFEKILPNDTVESLYQRLKIKENQMYIKVLKKLCRNS